jgi:hypothetical protein
VPLLFNTSTPSSNSTTKSAPASVSKNGNVTRAGNVVMMVKEQRTLSLAFTTCKVPDTSREVPPHAKANPVPVVVVVVVVVVVMAIRNNNTCQYWRLK